MSAVTIRDVAASMGVAVSTVSRALRDATCISRARREAVQAAARRLGYQPNPLVSALMAQLRPRRHAHRPVAVALLHSYPRGQPSFSLDYERGIRQRAEAFGYRVEPLHLENLAPPAPPLDRVLDARNIHGLIVLPVPVGIQLGGVSFKRLAAATVDPSLKCPRLHRASPDYFQGMTTAVEHLSARGYRRIAFVTSTTEVAHIGDLWLAAFLRWQSTQPPSRRLAVYMPPHNDPPTFGAWLRAERPDAIVSNHAYLLKWLSAAGIRVPRDIAYARLSVSPELRVAGIDQRAVQVGCAAFDLVVSQLNRNEYGLPAAPQTVLVEGFWVDGPTVRRAAGAARARET